MESAALTTENLRNTMATIDAMQVANKELRKQYGKIDIDKIEAWISFYICTAVFDIVSRVYIMIWRTS